MFKLCLFPFAILVVTGSSAFAVQTSNADDTEILAVYSTILDEGRFKNARTFVVEDMSNRGGTMMDEMIDEGRVPGSSRVTIKNYKKNNAASRSLVEILGKRSDVMFNTQGDIDAKLIVQQTVFVEQDWTAFENRYRGTHRIYSFSNVGFNTARTQALVYFAYYCGPLCAGGSFFSLEKKGTRWKIAREVQLWVS